MILVAPTAFKGTHSAADVAAAAASAARDSGQLDVRELPVSDGGPGLIDSLVIAGWQLERHIEVAGPIGSTVSARIISNGNEAAFESADACGLSLVPVEQRDPMRTTTLGVGQLLGHASKRFEHVYVGLGGSATIDCGLGMAAALGWELQNERGTAIENAGRGVLELARIAGTPRQLARVTALADVQNPLFGPRGAPRVFGAQKGATREQIALLDAGLEKVTGIIRRDLGVDVANLEGGGAAGGLGAGLRAFARATIVSGSAWLLEQLQFDELLAQADLVITGEGSFDAQSSMGKITGEVIRRAAARSVPVLLVAGRIEGTLPPHVYGVGNRQLTLSDIEELVRGSVAQLLAQ